MLMLKSGAKLRFFFGLCKCLSDNFLKYFLCVVVGGDLCLDFVGFGGIYL